MEVDKRVLDIQKVIREHGCFDEKIGITNDQEVAEAIAAHFNFGPAVTYGIRSIFLGYWTKKVFEKDILELAPKIKIGLFRS